MLRRTLSRLRVSPAKTDPVPSNKEKLALYSDPNLGAGKTLQCPQANKCSSVCLSQTFRSPLNVSNIIPPTHLSQPSGPSSTLEAWPIAVASNLRMPRCRRCILPPKPPRRQRKTLEPIDGVRKQISDPTVGQRLKVAGRNHSASTSPASQMLMSLLGKVSPPGIFKVSAVDCNALSAKRSTFRAAKLRGSTARYRHCQILRCFVFYICRVLLKLEVM